MFGFVCRKMGLFAALLHREKVFCQFSASHADSYLILLKRKVFVCFGLSYVVFSIMLLRRGFSLTSYVNCAFHPLQTCFGVLAMKSDVSSILLQTNSDLVFRF